MALRTVRLDPDSEEILEGLTHEMGLSVSAVFKEGLLALRNQRVSVAPKAYEIFSELDLGPGGYALAPSTQTRRGVEEVLRRRRRE
jgi:hypothetical protein